MNPSIYRSCLLIISLVALAGCGTVNDSATGMAKDTAKDPVKDTVASDIATNQAGPPAIVVKLDEQKAVLLRGGKEVAKAPISSGREGYRTPTGRFSVIRKEPSHRSGVYGDYVDGGGQVVVSNVDARRSRQPRGTHFLGASMPYFMEFKPGYGLHAGYLPGYPASHGCVRLPSAEAQQFYNAAHLGTPVTVTH
jgi:lipoprotein-anchoring transpeptidase ErfK/SrfK